jgi:hypothetical protein
MRHAGATGKLRMVSMRELPVGEDRSRSITKGGCVLDEQATAGHAVRSCRLSSGNIKTDYIDPVHSSANWNLPQIANLHRQG